jgi:hypothetical protein
VVPIQRIEPRIGGLLDFIRTEGAVMVGIPLLHESVDLGARGFGLRRCPEGRERKSRKSGGYEEQFRTHGNPPSS